LLNARHSGLHELVARHLAGLPEWVAQPEVSFAFYADRGVIDILAWHPGRRALLVIELKTDIADVNELVGTVDKKGRQAIEIAIERGWIRAHDPPPSVSDLGHRRRRPHEPPSRPGPPRDAARGVPADGRAIGGWPEPDGRSGPCPSGQGPREERKRRSDSVRRVSRRSQTAA
jgi:hypothetical protein